MSQIEHAVAHLTPRDVDELIGDGQLLKCFELFRQLKKPPSVEKYPVVLRRYRAGDVICHQGDAGNSAFYIAHDVDVAAFRRALAEARPEAPAARREAWRAEAASLEQAGVSHERVTATAQVFRAGESRRRTGGWLSRLASALSPSKSSGAAGRPRFIPNDGPTDIDYQTREAPMFEGDVFGEMSCMTFQPRSATVVAARDCYMVEFLRNNFDRLQQDEGYRKRADEVYAKRVLETHLGRLEFFRDLDDRQLQLLKDQATLQIADPGEVLCHEGHDSDCVFIIRNGIVQVVRGVRVALHAEGIVDWPGFCRALLKKSGEEPRGPAAPSGSPPPQLDSPQQAHELDDILKQARVSKAAAPSKAAPPAPKKPGAKPGEMSMEEMLAAARGKKPAAAGPSDAAPPGETTSAASPAAPPAPKKPGAKPGVKPGEMSIEEMMAAARGKKSDAAGPSDAALPGETTSAASPAAPPAPKKPGAKPGVKPGEMSMEEMMAAARGKKPAAAGPSDAAVPGETTSAASPASPPAPKKPGVKPGAKPGVKPGVKPGEMSMEEMMAAARGKKPRAAGPSDSAPVAVESSEPLLDGILTKAPAVARDAPAAIWSWLGGPVRAAIHRVAAGDCDPALCESIVVALNRLLRTREFLSAKPVSAVLEESEHCRRVHTFPQGVQGIVIPKSRRTVWWTELQVYAAGRMLVEALFPEHIESFKQQAGPPRIVNYLSRGDCFGEMGVWLNEPRVATCIAYDHPSDDPKRQPSRVELVRIPGAAFRSLAQQSPALQSRVDQLVASRRAELESMEREDQLGGLSLVSSQEFRDEGLAQGQKLMLIDLDLCTRCGDCVRACIDSHDDGRTRLFLDGPRFDRFLVPSSCRNCLDPACMIGCPVGSIQKGSNGQIVIEDWCIGCGLCAEQCPYDSIQMHDLGVIRDHEAGWLYAPRSACAGDWTARRHSTRGWQMGIAPFVWSVDLLQRLRGMSANPAAWRGSGLAEAVCFRRAFDVTRPELESFRELKIEFARLSLQIRSLGARVLLDGAEVPLVRDWDSLGKLDQAGREQLWERVKLPDLAAAAASDKKLSKRLGEGMPAELARDWPKLLAAAPPLTGEPLAAAQRAVVQAGIAAGVSGEFLLEADLPIELLSKGSHVVVVECPPTPLEENAVCMSLRIDGVPQRAEAGKLYTQRAVVCDQCSSRPGQSPACVEMCPHNAAMRVNARFEFPVS